MNILISSIGTRRYLIEHFKDALGSGGQVFAADADKFAPSLGYADRSFVIPRADSDGYCDALLQIHRDHRLDAVLSINDLELPFLAAARDELTAHGIRALISEPDIIDICFDKYRTYRFCAEQGIPVPRTYLCTESDAVQSDLERGELSLPVLAKPRRGSRSVGIYMIDDADTLIQTMREVADDGCDDTGKNMFQQYIDSDQYSLHILNDYSLTPVSVVGMVNIGRHMRGETFQIRSVKDPRLLDLGLKLGTALKHLGPMSADVHRINDTYVVLEMNPRLSGCYSLSHFANRNFTRNIVSILSGESVTNDIFDFEEDVIMLKQYDVFPDREKEIGARVQSYLD